MRVVCPFVPERLQQATTESVEALWSHVEYANVSSDRTAYFRLLCILWRKRESFIFVEHDMVVPQEATSLERCNRPWCYFEHDIGADPNDPLPLPPTLGLVRFRSSMIERTQLMLATAKIDWTWLDRHVVGYLLSRGYEPHCHGRAEHLRSSNPERWEAPVWWLDENGDPHPPSDPRPVVSLG
jgi:hypothetical protein